MLDAPILQVSLSFWPFLHLVRALPTALHCEAYSVLDLPACLSISPAGSFTPGEQVCVFIAPQGQAHSGIQQSFLFGPVVRAQQEAVVGNINAKKCQSN